MSPFTIEFLINATSDDRWHPRSALVSLNNRIVVLKGDQKKPGGIKEVNAHFKVVFFSRKKD